MEPPAGEGETRAILSGLCALRRGHRAVDTTGLPEEETTELEAKEGRV